MSPIALRLLNLVKFVRRGKKKPGDSKGKSTKMWVPSGNLT
jgi:hypothetical protein